jgi:possible C4-dicarboxylater TRAP-T family tripartite ATP-independent periplasmic transporter membrane protein, small subunit
MKKFMEKYNLFEERVLIVSLAFNVLLVFTQIIMRSIFNLSLSWSEELSRYIFIWQIWLGTSIAYTSNAHIKVELIYDIFKSEKAHFIIKLIVDLIWLIFNIFLTIKGIELLNSMNGRNVLSSGMRLPLIYIYASLPISSFMLSLRIILSFIDLFNAKPSSSCKKEDN